LNTKVRKDRLDYEVLKKLFNEENPKEGHITQDQFQSVVLEYARHYFNVEEDQRAMDLITNRVEKYLESVPSKLKFKFSELYQATVDDIMKNLGVQLAELREGDRVDL